MNKTKPVTYPSGRFIPPMNVLRQTKEVTEWMVSPLRSLRRIQKVIFIKSGIGCYPAAISQNRSSQ